MEILVVNSTPLPLQVCGKTYGNLQVIYAVFLIYQGMETGIISVDY